MPEPDADTPVSWAQRYAAKGWPVLPLKPDPDKADDPSHKVPRLKNGLTDASTDPEQIAAWWTRWPEAGIGIVTGAVSGLVVIDLDEADDKNGIAHWAELIEGQAMPRTLTATTARGGLHLVFQHPGEEHRVKNSTGKLAPGVDVRGDGGYIAAPPVDGRAWTDRSTVAPLPEWLLGRLLGHGTATKTSPGIGRPTLSLIVNDAPQRGQGLTNDWMVRAFGHLARHAPDQATYELAALGLATKANLADYEDYDKILESVWGMETEKRTTGVGILDSANGWLAGTGNALLTKVKHDDVEKMAEWSDFDLTANGVMVDDEGTRTFDVTLCPKHLGPVNAILPASIVADPRRLQSWLANTGSCSIIEPAGQARSLGSASSRMIRYLRSQDPPEFQAVSCLGWHDGRFITWDSEITAEGSKAHTNIKPNPNRRSWADFHYGFNADEDEARAVLREVLTFHDETYTSIVGAWWAASFLKPLLPGAFPLLVIEAPSESGKTTGFTPLLLQLGGTPGKPYNPTPASYRDILSGHNAGVVWVDDLNRTEMLEEILRQLTGGGVVTKKGEDRTHTERIQLSAATMLSGESFPAFHEQKALIDRSVILSPSTPTKRRSLTDPDRPQLHDIEAMQARYPNGLQTMAGTVAVMAIRMGTELLAGLRSGPSNRFQERMRILELGAHLLDAMTGEDGVHAGRFTQWAQTQQPSGSNNALVTLILPTVLARLGWPTQPTVGFIDHQGRSQPGPIPAYVKGDEVRFNIPALAEFWYEYKHGRISERTESKRSIEQQTDELRCRRIRPQRHGVDVRYRVLEGRQAAMILEQSSDSAEDRDHGQGVGVPTGSPLRLDLPHPEFAYWDPDGWTGTPEDRGSL